MKPRGQLGHGKRPEVIKVVSPCGHDRVLFERLERRLKVEATSGILPTLAYRSPPSLNRCFRHIRHPLIYVIFCRKIGNATIIGIRRELECRYEVPLPYDAGSEPTGRQVMPHDRARHRKLNGASP